MDLPHYQPFYLRELPELEAEIARLGLNIPLSQDLSILGTPGLPSAPNRFCAQPISGLDARPDGSPGPLTWHRYRRYAEGRFGMIWVEATVPGADAPPGRLRLAEDTVEAFAGFVNGIRDAARQRWGHQITLMLQLAKPLPSTGDGGLDAIDDARIADDVRDIARAAALAASAGFDGVDVKASHGATPGSLLSAYDREGNFGGPLEYRSNVLYSALALCRQLAPDLLLASRFCAYDAVCPPLGFGTNADDHRQHDLTETLQVVQSLREAGLGLLNVTVASPRLANNGPGAIPDHGAPDEHPLMVLARQLEVAGALREANPDLPVVGSGFAWLRHFLPEVAAGAINGGAIDFAGLGRGALAYPDAPADILEHAQMNPASTCMVCFACEQLLENGGPVGCPIRDPDNYAPACSRINQSSTEALQLGAERCHLCEQAPCAAASRTGTNIPGFISAFLQGDGAAAYEIIRNRDLLPEMTARLSPGWLHSEGACIESALSGSPVPILDLQFAIAWQAREDGLTGVRLPDQPSGRKAAIVGAGPAGIAAAARLLEHGHEIDLYERSDTLGGVPERVIPSSRLPSILPEIKALLNPALDTGRLRIHHQMGLGENLDLDSLCESADAVLLATGLWQERKLTGNDRVDGVIDALSFLVAAKHGELTELPARVAILAGGDCAMDAARSADLLGAEQIFIVFDGPRSEMHWHMGEDWFSAPGHHALMHCRPLGFRVDYHAQLQGLRVRHSELGKDGELAVGLVIEAMGLQIADPIRKALPGIALNEFGLVAVNDGSRTSRPGVHAAGGLVNGGASVARCVAEGIAAGDAIHAELGARTVSQA